jgi:four helix bundle protein
MHGFRNLLVWQKAHELTVKVYHHTSAFQSQYPSLASQLVSAAQSIPANIAEGSGRATAKQFAQSLQIAIGSAREVDYFLLLAADLDAITRRDHAMLEARADEVTRMLIGLRSRILRKPPAR